MDHPPLLAKPVSAAAMVKILCIIGTGSLVTELQPFPEGNKGDASFARNRGTAPVCWNIEAA
jgi:hypothetical protein